MPELPQQRSPVGQQMGRPQPLPVQTSNLKPTSQIQQNPVQTEEKKSKLWIWIVIILGLVVLGAGGYYFFFR